MEDLSSPKEREAFENDENAVNGTPNGPSHAAGSRVCFLQEGHRVVGTQFELSAPVPSLVLKAEDTQLVNADGEEEKDASTTTANLKTDPFSWLQEASPAKNEQAGIEVVVRIRPAQEPAACRTTKVLPDGKTLRLLTCPTKGSKKPLDQGRQGKENRSMKELQITFDCVLDEGATQNEVYGQVRPCVRAPFHGVSACIFAYGQTGSGKTYTMTGDHTASLKTAAELSQNLRLDLHKSVTRSVQNRYGVPSVSQRVEAPPAVTSEGQRQGPTLTEARAGDGIIPRAVVDVFRYARQCQDGDANIATTAAEGCRGRQTDRFGRHLQSTAARSATAPATDERNQTGTFSTAGTSASSASGDKRRSRSDPSLFAGDPVEAPRTPISPVDDVQQRLREKAKEDRDEGSGMRAGFVMEGQRGCTVECSYMQVYNGLVYDLLGDNTGGLLPLPVRQSTGVSSERSAELHRRDDEAEDGRSEDDPLSSGRGARRKSTSGGDSVSVVGLSSHHVECARQVMELLRRGRERRRVRSTEMNASSSRSHTIVQLTISRTTPVETPSICNDSAEPNRSENSGTSHSSDDYGVGGVGDGTIAEATGRSQSSSTSLNSYIDGTGLSERYSPLEVMTCAKLSLVDLAGSEKGGGAACRGCAEGEGQERERSKINSSLSALSNCISCLGETGRTHVPFRDNPLTRLLQDSLSRGKTVVIATITPSLDTQEESISTLNFAARCMRVTVRHRVNEVTTDAVLLHRARRHISFLRRRLREIENGSSFFCETNITHHSGIIATAADSACHLTPRETNANASDGDAQFVDERGKPDEPMNRSERQEQPVERKNLDGMADSTPLERYCMSLARCRHPSPAGTSGDATKATETRKMTDSSGSSGGGGGGSGDPARKSSRAYARRPGSGVERTCEGKQITASQHQRPFPVRGSNRDGGDCNGCGSGGGGGSSTGRLVSRGIPRRDGIRRTQSRKNTTVGDRENEEAFATEALIERFSCREGELLREVETWKARCLCLEEDAESSFTTGRKYCDDQHRECPPLNDGEMAGHSFSPKTCSPSSVHVVRTSTTSDSVSFRELADANGQHTCGSGVCESAEAYSCHGIDQGTDSGKSSQGELGGGEDVNCEEERGDVVRAEESGAGWALALYDLKGEQEGDLELRAGDMIKILSHRPDGWWYGHSRSFDLTGLFPSNFVQHIDEAERRLMFSALATENNHDAREITGTITACTPKSEPSCKAEHATKVDENRQFRSRMAICRKFESCNEVNADHVWITGDTCEANGIGSTVIGGNAANTGGGFIDNIGNLRVELASGNFRENKKDQETEFTGQWPFEERILHTDEDRGSDSSHTQRSRSGNSSGTGGGAATWQHTSFVGSSVSHEQSTFDESSCSCPSSSTGSRYSRSAGPDGDHGTNWGGDDAAVESTGGNACHFPNAVVESTSFDLPREAERAVSPNVFVKEAQNIQRSRPYKSWNISTAAIGSTFPTQNQGDPSPARRNPLSVSPSRPSSSVGAPSTHTHQAADEGGPDGCRQHGIPSCILCTVTSSRGDRLCSLLDDACASPSAGRTGYRTDTLNPNTVTTNSPNEGSVFGFTTAGFGDLTQGSVESRLQFPSNRHGVISQQYEMDQHQHQHQHRSTTCEQHLLHNCILCKMRRTEHQLCRSASLPALQHEAGSRGTDHSPTASPNPLLSNPNLPEVGNSTSEHLRSNLCERHSLPRCCLCGSTNGQALVTSLLGPVAVGGRQLGPQSPVQALPVFLPKCGDSPYVYGLSSPPLKNSTGSPAHDVSSACCGPSSPLTLVSTTNHAAHGGHQSRARFSSLTAASTVLALDAYQPRERHELAERNATSMFSSDGAQSSTGENASGGFTTATRSTRNNLESRTVNCYEPSKETGLHEVVDKVQGRGGTLTTVACRSAGRAACGAPSRKASTGDTTRRRKRDTTSSRVDRRRGRRALAGTSGARARLKGNKYGGGYDDLAQTAMTAAAAVFRC